MQNIAIIEDEETIRADLKLVLENAGYRAVILTDLTAAAVLAKLNVQRPDLVLLDVNLGAVDGYALARAIRRQDGDPALGQVPIIFLTGRSSAMDELEALTIGGDDFVTKPYHGAILLARIAALLKRSFGPANNKAAAVLTVHGLTLDIAAYTVGFRGQMAELSKTECRLLSVLMRQAGQVVTRSQLLDHLWDHDVFIDDNALSVNMTRLRSRLQEVGAAGVIKTKRGVGYWL